MSEATALRLAFTVPPELGERVSALLDAIEREDDPIPFRGELADRVVELTEAGLHAYFLEPLERAEVNVLVRQSAALGIATGVRTMGGMIRGIIGRLDGRQIRAVCACMREMVC